MFRKFLVTGAAGFLGRAVVSKLLAQGAQVFALVLKGDPNACELPAGVTAIEGDVCDRASLEDFFSQADASTCVIHCAGIVSVASKPEAKLYLVNVEGTKNILRMCAAHGVGKLVYVSSVHAIAEKPRHAAQKSTRHNLKGLLLPKCRKIQEPLSISPELVDGDYAKSKAMATGLVMDAAKKGLNASIVYPSGIIGPGDLAKGSITSMLLSFLAGKLPAAVKGGYDFVDVRDVAKGIVSCAKCGEAGQGYILSGHYATIRDILNIVMKAVKKKRKVLYLPLGLAKLVAPVYEKISLRRKQPLYFTPYAVSVLGTNANFSHQAATRLFGYAPRPLQASLQDTICWLQEVMLSKNARK